MILSPENHEALYGEIIERFTGWATAEPAIQAAMIIGSRARTDHPADPWSDLDIVAFADDPPSLLEDTGWLARLGDPAITFVHGTPVGGWAERRVLFRNGCELDIPIVPASVLHGIAVAAPDEALGAILGDVVGRGYRVLVDRSGYLGLALAGLEGAALVPPDQAMLDATLADFWYHCVWTAKKLRRGETYTAHDCLDNHLRPLMMRLVRWDAEQRGGAWHGTRFMEEWLASDVAGLLPGTWARHTPGDVARALEQMMHVISVLAPRIGEQGGLVLHTREEEFARGLVREILPPA